MLTCKKREKNRIIEFSTQWNISPIENANKPFFEVSLFALQTLLPNSQKNSEEARETQPSVLHPSETFSSRTCVRQELQDTCYKNATLQSDFTFPFSVTFRCWFWSWKDRSPKEYVSVVLQRIKNNPNRTTIHIQKSLFCWLCWAVWYTQEISQPHRITRSSRNNHCFTICLTHCEQGSVQHNRDTAR